MTSRRKSYWCQLEIMEDRLVLSQVTVGATPTPTAIVASNSTTAATSASTAITSPTPLSTFQQNVLQGVTSPLLIEYGPSGSVVPQGVVAASSQGYSSAQGYGWVGTVDTSGNVTGLTAASTSAGASVSGTSGQFRVDLPNGTYNVSLLFGNAATKGTLTIALNSNGQLGGSLSSGVTNSSLQLWTGQVNVIDGEMTNVLSGPFSLTSIQIAPVSIIKPVVDPLRADARHSDDDHPHDDNDPNHYHTNDDANNHNDPNNHDADHHDHEHNPLDARRGRLDDARDHGVINVDNDSDHHLDHEHGDADDHSHDDAIDNLDHDPFVHDRLTGHGVADLGVGTDLVGSGGIVDGRGRWDSQIDRRSAPSRFARGGSGASQDARELDAQARPFAGPVPRRHLRAQAQNVRLALSASLVRDKASNSWPLKAERAAINPMAARSRLTYRVQSRPGDSYRPDSLRSISKSLRLTGESLSPSDNPPLS